MSLPGDSLQPKLTEPEVDGPMQELISQTLEAAQALVSGSPEAVAAFFAGHAVGIAVADEQRARESRFIGWTDGFASQRVGQRVVELSERTSQDPAIIAFGAALGYMIAKHTFSK